MGPHLCRLGYGTRTVKLLAKYYSNSENKNYVEENAFELRKHRESIKTINSVKRFDRNYKLFKTKIRILLRSVHDRPSKNLQFLGVSFGLTQELFNFWHRNKFQPVYLRQKINEFTGSQKIIMVRIIEDSKISKIANWLELKEHDFKIRFITFLAGPFRFLTPSLALSILDPKLLCEMKHFNLHTKIRKYANEFRIENIVSRNFRRLKAFSDNISEYRLIADLVPQLARVYFLCDYHRSPINLTNVQLAVLLCIGLQHHEVTSVEKALNIHASQVMRQLSQIIKKLIPHLNVTIQPVTE